MRLKGQYIFFRRPIGRSLSHKRKLCFENKYWKEHTLNVEEATEKLVPKARDTRTQTIYKQ